MPMLRAAIRTRQKLRIGYRHADGTRSERTIRPLKMENWGRIWMLTAWCDLCRDFGEFRVDLIETARALPELFTDEPGKTLADHQRGNAASSCR
jgi:predicted DNA-binding transcriptional regulator YafY